MKGIIADMPTISIIETTTEKKSNPTSLCLSVVDNRDKILYIMSINQPKAREIRNKTLKSEIFKSHLLTILCGLIALPFPRELISITPALP